MLKQKGFMAMEYMRYCLAAENAKGHGVHSPFVYDFISNVLRDERHFYAFDAIEDLRNQLLANNTSIEVTDFGAGSHTGAGHTRRITDITRNAARTKKQGQFLFRLMQRYGYKRIVELGTSMGIGTAYLASASQQSKVISLEGCPQIAGHARQNLNSIGLERVEIITGNFDDTLLDVLKNHAPIDVLFIDGNHREEPTVRYFQQAVNFMSKQGVIIFDDIHWSRGMASAWKTIKQDPRVRLSLDLFYFGLVYFDDGFLEKQDFVLRF